MSSIIPYTKSEDSLKTETKHKKVKLTWIIKNFSFCNEKPGQSITSSTFDSEICDQLKCNLEIYPYGCNKESEEYISFYLCLEKSDKLPLPIILEFYILSSDGKKKCIQKIENSSELVVKSKYGFNKFVWKNFLCDNVNKLFPDDKLTLGCEISIICDKESITSFSTITYIEKHSTDLMDDVRKMLEFSKLSDCVIKATGIDINVHKFMLASRSDVFLSLFNDKKGKTESHIIEIKNFTPECVKEMVTYIYTGTSPNLNERACELLLVASKYNLKQLKSMAEECLCKRVNLKNVCNYLEISKRHSAESLKESCMTFIRMNASSVIKTDEWTSIATKYPLLLNEVLKYFVEVDKSNTNQ